jgi:hypothetical protein
MANLQQGVTIRAPETVAALAAERGLGELIDKREGTATRDAVGGQGIAAAVCLALLILCVILDASLSANEAVIAIVAPVLRISLIATVVFVGWTIRALLRGQRAWYHYAGGMIQKGRSGARAVAWAEAAELKLVHSRRGDNVRGGFCYQLTSRGGASLMIPLKARQGDRDPFVDQILAAARQHNCPVA